MKNSVESRVVQVIEEVFGNTQKIELSAKIGTDFALTSLERMSLFISLEDEFEKTIPQNEIENLETVGEIVEFIEKNIEI